MPRSSARSGSSASSFNRSPPRSTRVSSDVAAAARTAVLDGLAAECVSALRGDGTPVLLLKGPATAGWLFPGQMRDYTDVDLLVSPGAFSRAGQTLARLGFRNIEANRSESELVVHATTYVLERPPLATRFPAGLAVDLHRTFHGIGVGEDEFWRVASDGAVRLRVAGVDVDVPSEPMRAMLVVLHAARSGAGVRQPIEDLDRALQRLPDDTWRAALELARRLHAAHRFAAGLGMRAEGRELVDRLGIDPEIDVASALYAHGIPPVAEGIRRLVATGGLGARARLLARELFPTPSFMRAWSRLARRGSVGLLLAYAYRPPWLVAKLPAALAAHRRARQRAARSGRAGTAESS